METIQLTKTWTIDTSHSRVQFKIKHLVISTVSGSFDAFEGEVKTNGEHFDNAEIFFVAKTESINTHNKERDNHLRSEDFFYADKYPELKFRSVSFRKVDHTSYRMPGDLTIKDKTNRIELNVLSHGEVVDPNGIKKAAFEITGQLNRKDFNLQWGPVTETGSLVVAEEVKLMLEITLVLK